MQTEHRTLAVQLADQRVEHESYPEPTPRVNGAVVPPEFLMLPCFDFLLVPHLLYPAILARLPVANAIPVFPPEDEFLIVAFDVGGNRYADVVLLYDFVGGGALGEVDVVELLLFDVDEADGVCGFFPEGGFTEGAVELEPWLEGVAVRSWLRGGEEDGLWCWDGGLSRWGWRGTSVARLPLHGGSYVPL